MIIIIIVTVLQRIYNTLYTCIYHSGTRNNKDDEQPKRFELECFETKQIYISITYMREWESFIQIYFQNVLFNWMTFCEKCWKVFFPHFPISNTKWMKSCQKRDFNIDCDIDNDNNNNSSKNDDTEKRKINIQVSAWEKFICEPFGKVKEERFCLNAHVDYHIS